MPAVRQRKRDMVDSFRNGSQQQLTSAPGVDLIFGAARFSGPKSVLIRQDGTEREITADKVFINTGDHPAQPAIEGLHTVPALDSTSVMELAEIPAHLLVLGGGYVGLEFAQMFRRFGSRVTVVNRGPQLLGREDADVAEAIQQIFAEDGIDVLLNAASGRVSGSLSGGIELTVQEPGGERKIAGSHVLVATGRKPNSDHLNLAAAGVETDERRVITVNDRLETTAPDIYALGDVKGGPAFTHISYDDFRIIRHNLLEGGQATTKDRMVPYCVYTDPQLGRIGMTEREAPTSGRPVKVARLPMTSVARALEAGETRGFVKAVVDPDSRQILGAACLSLEGGEIMSMFEIAMMGKLPYTALRDGIFAHPTLAELLNNLFARLED